MFNKQCRTTNPNLNAIGMWTKGFAGPRRSAGLAGRAGHSSSLLCMKSLTVYHLQDKNTHTDVSSNCVCVSVCVWVKATCGTETEIYADMKTLPWASVRRSIRRSRRRRKSLSGLRPSGIAGAGHSRTSCYSMQHPELDGIDFCVPARCR